MTVRLDMKIPAASPLFADYDVDARRYHEAFDGSAAIRPQWRALLADLEQAGAAQMRQRQQFVARQIRENGVTYNIYDDAKGAERPWDLDLLPHLIAADEWQLLAAGVAQRASLLDAVLGDLYGAQNLLREGLLPSELIYGHSDFLWPCEGIAPPGGRFLHVYAADLARAPDGRWWVIADRAQAPSGAGYALENRQIVSRAFGETFRELKVQSLDGFFRSLQASLQRLAPSDGAAPLAVLLTPGRYNETYFEHVYLARALGVPLVEGQDLTVRGATLYLKTLGGLQRVHAILRRIDADFCDPLELRGDSALGVPGLLEVARAGRVLIANALGSGVIESPGLLGFLPRVCECLRGEALLLPTVATWWCGEAPACAEVLANLDRVVIKPAFPSQRFDPVFGPMLSRSRRTELRARIEAHPQAYVAQELIELSHAPVWQRGSTAGKLVPRAVSTRVYAVATEHGYAVMPGGLTRVAAKPAALVVSMQRGGGSKDTWVLGDAAVDAGDSQRRPLGVRDVVRRDAFLPSRLVENLFWLGRYSERSDNITRLLRVLLARYIDGGSSAPALASALEVCRVLELTPPKLALKNALLAAVTGGAGGGLRDTLERLFWAATQVRGRLSQENWRGIVELQREATALSQQLPDVGDAMEFLNRLLMSVSALSGFALDDMTRDEGWRFLVIGRRLERLQFLADVVAVVLRDLATHARERDETATLDWLLELADSIITYRMRYLSAPQLIPALDLVLLDAANPHAVQFQVRELVQELAQISGDEGEAATLRRVEEDLAACDLGALEDSLLGETGRRDALAGIASLLASTAAAARDVSDRLAARYFAHVDDISQPTIST
jgi:uncharacterized circularly permuted ATP-grasp superfamily protein/uncharacterized alpha-E superfamily protein